MSPGRPCSERWPCSALLCLWSAAAAACIPVEPLTRGSLTGAVYLSAPVAGATVQVQLLDEDGQVSLSAAPVLTDESGRFTVDLGTSYGRVRIVATGGQTIDLATGERVPLETELRAVLFHYYPTYPLEVAVTPLSTLATALGERRFQRGDQEPSYFEALARAYALLGTHAGGFDLVHTRPHDPGERVVAQDPASVYHGLVLAALSSLAARMARESNLSPRSLHTGHLLEALLADASGPEARLDGTGAGGPVRLGACPPPLGCAPGDACTTLCDLDANTLRADLATSLAFDFVPSAQNRTGWTFEDVQPLVETLQTNAEPELFGTTPTGDLGGALPTLRVLPAVMDDEAADIIELAPGAVPIHTGQAEVELGPGTTCPTVHKHTHRLDDPDENPIRWRFEVRDERGVAIRPDAGAYRVRLRDGEWLTDWLPARPMGSVERGVEYEAVLLRPDLPALGTTQGIFEIALRGQDALGAETAPVIRCWEHVPLAAPIQVADVGQVVGPGSLHAANLDPGNNLAPLLNGVPLEEGRGVMEFTLRNGTTELVYARLPVEQSVATYLKSWQKTNAKVEENGESDCLGTGECSLGFPPDRGNTIVTDEPGIIDELVSGIRVRDLTTGELVGPCTDCEPDEYLLEPRLAAGTPRAYRVTLVATDLSALAPQPFGAAPQTFLDEPLDAELLPIPITGRAIGRGRKCLAPDSNDPQKCVGDEEFAHYVALTRGSLTMNSLQVTARTRSHLDVPSRVPVPGTATLGVPVQLDGAYVWTTSEIPLPEPPPDNE